MDPFGSFDVLPSNPIRSAIDSVKMRVREVGQLVCTAAGFGFIMVYPYTLMNDTYSIAFSDTGFVGTEVQTVTATPGVGFTAWSGSPVSAAQRGDIKIVGCSVKVCDVGRALDTAGTILKYSFPNNIPKTYLPQSQEHQVISNKYSQINQTCCYFNSFQSQKVSDDEVIPFASQGTVDVTGGVFGLIIRNAAPGRVFNFEVCGIYEYIPDIGSPLGTFATDSHVSRMGPKLAHHSNSTNQEHLTMGTSPTYHAVAKVHNDVLQTTAKEVNKIPLLGGIASDLIKGVDEIPVIGEIANGLAGLLL
jgi:hypothetical protein